MRIGFGGGGEGSGGSEVGGLAGTARIRWRAPPLEEVSGFMEGQGLGSGGMGVACEPFNCGDNGLFTRWRAETRSPETFSGDSAGKIHIYKSIQ
jgi:hypothetical protein